MSNPTYERRRIANAAAVAAEIDAQRRQIDDLRAALAVALAAKREAEQRAQRALKIAATARRERDAARAQPQERAT